MQIVDTSIYHGPITSALWKIPNGGIFLSMYGPSVVIMGESAFRSSFLPLVFAISAITNLTLRLVLGLLLFFFIVKY